MAQGLYSKTVSIAAATDTALIAAPTTTNFAGKPERIYVLYLRYGVGTAWTGGRIRFEDGAGGSVIMRGATATVDVDVERYFATMRKDYPGYALTEGNALNVNTAGTPGALEVTVIYEIK